MSDTESDVLSGIGASIVAALAGVQSQLDDLVRQYLAMYARIAGLTTDRQRLEAALAALADHSDEIPAGEPPTPIGGDVETTAADAPATEVDVPVETPEPTGHPPSAPGPPSSGDEPPSWEQIAEVWLAAEAEGRSPSGAMSGAFGRPVTTTRNWTGKLRSRGLIPPAGVSLDEWRARNTTAEPAPAATPTVPADDQPRQGCTCSERGCDFAAPEPGARAAMRTHALAVHDRRAMDFELVIGVLE